MESEFFIKKLIKFAIVGAIGTLVNIFALFIFTEFFRDYYIYSEIIAFFVSVINNYILNKIWTFKETLQENILNRYIKYSIVSIISLGMNLSALYVLVEVFGFWYILAEIGGNSMCFYF